MNVNDFNVEIPPGDMLETIFSHQRDLIDRYHDVEETVVGHRIPSTPYGEMPHPAVGDDAWKWDHAGSLNIQDKRCQWRMKDFAWRIAEEITEATLALCEEDETHYLEELIDALHFSVELLTMCGIEPSDLAPSGVGVGGDILETVFYMADDPPTNPVPYQFMSYLVIEKLGEGMNRLKCKPWKTTGVLTDEKLFRQSMIEFFSRLIDLLKASGLTAKTTTQLYLNKNAVNQFRIASKY